MITQLNPPLPVITPLGKAQAHFVQEVSTEHYWMFACWHDKTGECFIFPHHQLRLTPNISNGHPTHTPIQPVEGLEAHEYRYVPSAPECHPFSYWITKGGKAVCAVCEK